MAGKGKIPRTIEGVDIQQTITSIRQQLDADHSVSPTLRASIDLLILVVTLLANRLGLNSQNNHTPPSANPNREKTPRQSGLRKPSGQPGHQGNQSAIPAHKKCLVISGAGGVFAIIFS